MDKARPLPAWVTARRSRAELEAAKPGAKPSPARTEVVARQREAWNRRDRARAPLTRSVRMKLIDEAGALCTYCGGQGTADPWWDSHGPDGRRWHFDHWTPLSRGGSLDLSNVVLACAACNAIKGTRLGSELIEWILSEEQTDRHTPQRARILTHMLGNG